MEDEIRRLRDQTALTRYRFLTTELETCFTALGFAEFELAQGNTPAVLKEIACVEKGSRTIQRFLSEVSGEPRTELEAKLAQLQAALHQLKAASAGAAP